MKATRQSRVVPALYGGIAGALLLVIAALALVFVPPSPPSVSEFAPTAQETIEEALANQSSQFGSGSGTCAEGQQGCVVDASGNLVAKAAPKRQIDKSRVRRCIGDPPRQIEDPQSPPCVNYFEGDNGGLTYKGVTPNEIKIGFAYNALNQAATTAMVSFFNRRFEFYGRLIRPISVPFNNTGDPAAYPGNAAGADELGVFAVILPPHTSMENFIVYRRELARRGIVSFAGLDSAPSQQLDKIRPYSYDYPPALSQMGAHLVEFTCKSLVGLRARYAGPALQAVQRKMAILIPDKANFDANSVDPVADGIERCGGEVSIHPYKDEVPPLNPPGPENQVLLVDLSQQDVTTLIPYGGSAPVATLMSRASPMGYQPEWLLPGSRQQYYEVNWQKAPSDQTQHLFGMVTMNKSLPLSDEPWYWAYRESGFTHDPVNDSQYFHNMVYKEILLLASGIQAAGPLLNPQSMERGLQRLAFPNPGAAGPPYYQATVGLSKDHSMLDDVGIMWWSPAARAYGSQHSENGGGWCYVGKGTRWKLTEWPKGEPLLFDPNLDNCR